MSYKLGNKILGQVLNLIYPPSCIACKSSIEAANNLCGDCWGKLEWIVDPSCDICHFPFEYEIEGDVICGNCAAKKPYYDKARSAFIYNDITGKLISSFKYSDKTYPVKTYSNWMFSSGKDLWDDVDYITPVPLHWKRLLQRRYNQSATLTRHLSKISGKEAIYNLMIKAKNTSPQASLSKNKRLRNVKGAFGIKNGHGDMIKDKNIMIIDDVTTTGATVNECAKVLKKHGAGKVYVLTLAKTLER